MHSFTILITRHLIGKVSTELLLSKFLKHPLNKLKWLINLKVLTPGILKTKALSFVSASHIETYNRFNETKHETKAMTNTILKLRNKYYATD